MKKGFTLIELLVVVAILALLVALTSVTLLGNTAKARDARRKVDLGKIKIAFEDYYNDAECYPAQDAIDNCNSDDLSPYLNRVPCDPQTKQPYVYQPESNCAGYQLYARMERLKDVVLNAGACFGVAVGVEMEPPSMCDDTTIAGGGGTPPPTGGGGGGVYMGGRYACDPNGQCNAYDDPVAAGCPVTYDSATVCQNGCNASSANWCDQ